MKESMLVEPGELAAPSDRVLFDCRFSLPQPDAGREAYLRGHIPGAHYLDLNRDLSGPVARRGGRHPLPAPETFAATLARFGVDRDTRVIAYDDSRFAFASRLWWMMRSLGFRPPQLLNGGYGGWLATGGQPQTAVPEAVATAPAAVDDYSGYCDHKGLRLAQGRGALVVDSREERRFLGLEEPIDPVAGHIPGAINRPWQSITAESGRLRPWRNCGSTGRT